MATNVRKTVTDAGYIAIGLGVMGVQQAQATGRELRSRAGQASSCVQHRAKDAQAKFESQSRTARARAEARVRTTANRAQDLRDELGKRIEPVVGQVQAQLGDLPERVVQAMEPVAARVRELSGNAA